MKSIMIALLRIAIDEEIIVENPMNGIYIKAKFRVVRKKSDSSKLYLNDEMEEKVHIFDGENFKSAGIQIMEHLKKENDSGYSRTSR